MDKHVQSKKAREQYVNNIILDDLQAEYCNGECWSYYVEINFARHQPDTKRTHNHRQLFQIFMQF